jgi:hypothetical protein
MPLLWVAILTSVAALENKSAVTLTLRIEGETRLSFSPPKQKQFMAGLSMATAIIPHDTSILHINSHGGTECMSFCEVLVGVELLVSGPADVRRLRKRLSGRHFERTLAARMHDSGFDFFVAAHNVALVRSSIAYPPRRGGPSSSSSQGSSNSNSSGLAASVRVVLKLVGLIAVLGLTYVLVAFLTRLLTLRPGRGYEHVSSGTGEGHLEINKGEYEMIAAGRGDCRNMDIVRRGSL